MRTYAEADIIASVRDALQFIACYHPVDFIRHLTAAYEAEQPGPARDAMAQLLLNSRMSALDKRPMCQDTGTVNVFVKVGIGGRIAANRSLQEIIDDAVRQAYSAPDNPLRASVVADPLFLRPNTRDNTPAVVHAEIVAGDLIDITVAAKGGGSENKAKFAVLNPADSVADWVVETVKTLGAGWCPPGVLGIGVGGTSEKAMLLAKEVLMEPLDMSELRRRGPHDKTEALRLEILERVNALGIGAQGLGGATTVLDVKIRTFPTHAASMPVALIPNCAANRHMHFTLDGTGPAHFDPPDLKDWPANIAAAASGAMTKVNLDTLTRAEIATWKPGQRLLLSGKLLTGRDAAHRRMAEMIKRGEPLPVSLANRMIYYVGPVDPVRDEAVGPAGPTTANRMDRYTDVMLSQTGLIGMIGKAERGEETRALIAQHGAVYLIGVGGAGYLISKAIKASRVLAFPDLGMEAIHEFEVAEMPVIVAIDAAGTSIHDTGPAAYARRDFAAEDMTGIRDAIGWTLERHAPYPGFALDRHWVLRALNTPAQRLFAAVGLGVGESLVEALATPGPLRSGIENWPDVARHMAARLRTESRHAGGDPLLDDAAHRMLEGLSPDDTRPGVLPAVLTTRLRLDDQTLTFFSTIAQFGSAEDIAIADLRIELLFPLDGLTRNALQAAHTAAAQ